MSESVLPVSKQLCLSYTKHLCQGLEAFIINVLFFKKILIIIFKSIEL